MSCKVEFPLFKGGRLILTKAALVILTYFLSLFVVPTSVVGEMEKMQRDILYKNWEDNSIIYLVAQDFV